jgi:hypothetical protein
MPFEENRPVVTVERLVPALASLQPHYAHVLRAWALLPAPSLSALAQLEGIGEHQASVLLLRAIRALEGALTAQAVAALDDAEEALASPRFAQALGAGQPNEGASLALTLCALAPELGPALEQARQTHERSPRQRLEGVLRWVAIAAILALSGWMYLRDHTHPKFMPRPVLPPSTR